MDYQQNFHALKFTKGRADRATYVCIHVVRILITCMKSERTHDIIASVSVPMYSWECYVIMIIIIFFIYT